MLLLLFYAAFPIFNPYLWKKTERQKEIIAAAKQTKGRTDSVIDALGMVFRVLGESKNTEDIYESAAEVLSRDGEKVAGNRWVADLFGPNAAGLEDGLTLEEKIMGRFVSFYTAPIIKFLVRFLIHVVNLILYTVLINNFYTAQQIEENQQVCIYNADWECMTKAIPLLSEFRPIELAWLVFELSFFSDMRHQKTTRSMKRMPSKIGVGQLAYASDVLVVVSFALRCAMEGMMATQEAWGSVGTVKSIYTAYQIIISVKVALIFFQTLLYLIIYRPLGVLVVTLTDMVGDVAQFGILLAVTICSFMTAFVGLQKAGSFHSEMARKKDLDEFDITATDGPLATPWWALFGHFDPAQYDFVSSIFVWLYLFMSSIILVNLLIAMFSETFNRVNLSAEQEHRTILPSPFYLRYTLCNVLPDNPYYALSAEQEFQHMFFDKVQEHHYVLLALPPVLNLPYIWFDMLRTYMPCLGYLCRDRPKKEKQAVTTQIDSVADLSLKLSQESMLEEDTQHNDEDERHVHIDKHADAAARIYDGRALAEVYLAQQAELASQTLLERTSALNHAMDEAKGEREGFYCEAKARLAKLEQWMVAEQEHREMKADPEARDQTERIKRIEVCIGKVMDALNIKETVAEVQVPVIPVKRRRRNPASYVQEAFGDVKAFGDHAFGDVKAFGDQAFGNVKAFVQDPKVGMGFLNAQTETPGRLMSDPVSLSPGESGGKSPQQTKV